MTNGAEIPSIPVKDWRSILTRLEGTLNVLAELRRELSLVAEVPTEQPAFANAMHEAFVDYNLRTLSRFRKFVLRPIAKNAVWVDMPTTKTFKAAEVAARDEPGSWIQAFPDYKETVTNIVGNEGFLMVERHGTGTHRGPMRVNDRVINPTGRKFEVEIADIVKFEKGEIVRIHSYYDMVTVLRRLGLMPDIPLGHDERDATPQPVIHASGFLRRTPEVRSAGRWPTRVGQAISIGSSKTRTAQLNAANCNAIHEAFIEHKPERFADLIADDGIWIDVPTGEILSAAAAAAHHDHGNWQTAFPDSSAEVTNLIANDAWVCVEHRGFGAHSGPLRLGGKVFEPTGRMVDIRVFDIVQYKDGKAILIRNYYDMAMMLVQLGIIPG